MRLPCRPRCQHVGLIVRRADEPERRLSRIEQLQHELHVRQLELAGLMAQEMSERRLDAAIRHCR